MSGSINLPDRQPAEDEQSLTSRTDDSLAERLNQRNRRSDGNSLD
jgi:hypothetical protein